MAQPKKIDLGAFAQGEVPPPLVHTFLDFDGNPVDLSGFTTTAMRVEASPTAPHADAGSGTITLLDQGTDPGKVQYDWHVNDMGVVSEYQAQLWVSNGVNKYASDLIVYTVYDGPGVPV